MQDPQHQALITPDFPYTLTQLVERLNDITESDQGRRHFSDSTRHLIRGELTAPVHQGHDPDKTRLIRIGGIIAEMHREMAYQFAVSPDKPESWLATFEKVEAVWNKLKPFLAEEPN